MRSCVVQVIINRHGSVVTSSNWVRCSPDCTSTSFAEMESRWFGCSRASAAWSRPRLGTSRSSTSPSRSPSSRCLSEYSSQLPSKWPERYHAVMISARAVRQYAHLPGSVSQFLHQLTYHDSWRRHLLNIHNMRRRCLLKIPFDLFTLPFQIVDYIGEV